VSERVVPGEPWKAHELTLLHLNWTRGSTCSGHLPESDYSDSDQSEKEDRREPVDNEKPLRFLDWKLGRGHSGRIGSFAAAYLSHSYGVQAPDLSVPYESTWFKWPRASNKDERQWIEILSRRQKWLVVMRTVIVHAPRTVHATGLFGILGDAPIQIVDIRDQERIHALFDLAEACENESSEFCPSQSFYRSSVEEMECYLRDILSSSFGSAELSFELRPTVMFRWCPLMCNHRGKAIYSGTWPRY
jgi:hypothetical protein